MAYLPHWVRGDQRGISQKLERQDHGPGLTADLQQIDDARKTAVIDRELARLNVDIAALQKTRLADNGTIREANYTFYWQGKSSDQPRQHSVGFAVRNKLVSSMEPPTAGTERLLTLRLLTSSGPVNILSVYAPTLSSTAEEKDQFYQALDEAISRIPSTDGLYLLGDFNARVGADHEAWPTCLGSFGRGKINENGQRLLELSCHHGLCVTNTFFKCKEIHQMSWRHPRSRHWHQLDLVITRRADIGNVLLTAVTRVQTATQTTPSWQASNPERTQQFISRLEDALSEGVTANDTIDFKWPRLRDAVYNTAIIAYGKKERKNADWYEVHWEEMEPVTEAKRKALLAYKAKPSPSTLQALRTARSKAQQTARHCANTYWLNLCSSIQAAADTGNTRGMYEGIKKATGPTPSKTAPSGPRQVRSSLTRKSR
ncbi:hypothetical protein QQF64_018465 [Cirrhinus molitorella]|uniref:Endonuclease/exonuclease/phosphatase domain-containing protein n=1 Tax=Cirrhinus molitorella TaxID=172907 RepID=A0ABR3LCM6_9TELE